MEIINEIILDYSMYCDRKIIDEFGTYDDSRYDPIYLYQRYKYRIIEARKRIVLEAQGLAIPGKYKDGYEEIKNDISNGIHLKKYQSRKLKKLDYNDDMLSHWGIQHLHLGQVVEEDGYVKRTHDLLFIFFKEQVAYIVGFFNHDSWCNTDIIEVIHANWPEALSAFKMVSNSKKLTSKEYKILRSKNVSANIILNDGTEYIAPGMGVTANGAPISVVLNIGNIIYRFNNTFEIIKKNIHQILDSDPQKRKSATITIGMEMCQKSKQFIYNIKETGFKFILS